MGWFKVTYCFCFSRNLLQSVFKELCKWYIRNWVQAKPVRYLSVWNQCRAFALLLCICCVFELYKPSVTFFVWRRQLPTTSDLAVLYICLRNEIISLREAVRYYYNVSLLCTCFRLPLVRTEMALEACVYLHILYLLFGFSIPLVRIMNTVLSGLTIRLIKQKMWDVGEYSTAVLLK